MMRARIAVGDPFTFRHGVVLSALFALAASLGCSALLPTKSGPPASPAAFRNAGSDRLEVAAAKSRALEAFVRRPIQFEASRGQTDAQVLFLSRGGGHTLFLTRTGALLALHRPSSPGSGPSPSDAPVVSMTWKGASARAQVSGLEQRSGETNYLRGNDPSKWVRGVPSFAKVQYKDLYPGVDLVFYGNQQRLEYDFILAPGADPGVIRLAFSGEQALTIDEAGNLVIDAGGERIVQRAPVVYQDVDGTRRAVAGWYEKRGRHEVAFRVGGYDAARTLSIDPVLAFSTFLGGSGYDTVKGVAVDAAGAVYVTGYTASTNLSGAGTRGTTDDDVFVAKFSSSGSLVYSTYVGDSNTADDGRAIAVDASGAAYVTGDTYYPGSGNAFPNVNGFATVQTGGGFVFKLNPAGSALLYSTTLASGSSVTGFGIAVDSANRAYVVGMAVAGNSFPLWPAAGPNSLLIGSAGTYEAFVVKIDPAASGLASLVYATRFGGWDWNGAYAVAVNGTGEAFVTGFTSSYDFPTAGTPLQPTCGSDGNCNTRVYDAYVARFNAAGTGLVYSTFLGGDKIDTGYAIAVDSANQAYVTGATYSPLFPTTAGAFDRSCGSNGQCNSSFSDVFVAKLNATGSTLLYSTFIGGNSSDAGYGIAVDAAGYAYVAGSVDSMDFPITANALKPTKTTNTDAFVSVLAPGGGSLAYSSFLGGSGNISGGDRAFGIAVTASGDAWVGGQTDSADFPVTAGAPQTTHGGGQFDGFVTRFSGLLSATALLPAGDFDGDHKADVALFRPAQSAWYLRYSGNGQSVGFSWGTAGDIPVPGDYDGDGKADIAVFRPSDGGWYVAKSSGGMIGVTWGTAGDIPVPADYDGDGKTDMAVFRPSQSAWYILKSGGGVTGVTWGTTGDIPVPADYDGDHKADIGVFRPSDSGWYIVKSTGGGLGVKWGAAGDLPVVGDFDGDGKADVGVFRASQSGWYIVKSSTGGGLGFTWGTAGDVPVFGDFDGDGKADAAVFRPSDGGWYVMKSSGGSMGVFWGAAGDLPV